MKVMYLTRDISVGGVTKCIYNLCKNKAEDVVPIICASGDDLRADFLALGIDCHTIPDVERRNPFVLLSTLGKIRKLLKREQIMLIHSHHRMTTLLAKLAVVGTPVKVIHTQHLNIQDKYYFTGLALANLPTICVSEAAKQILVEKSQLAPQNIHTIYNTIDPQTSNGDIDTRLAQAKEAGFFTVVQVSRLVDYKGVFEFLEIAEKVASHQPQIKFFLIGDGPERENLQQKIKQSNLEDTVFLLGNKPNVLKQLEAVDLMLLCSMIEGLPLAPIEAFYLGIPVIGSNIDGTSEEVEDGRNGYLIPQKETTTFAEKIVYLAENPEIYQGMKREAKKTFEEKFTEADYLSKHHDFYQQVLTGVSTASRNEQ